jgi:hydroxyethylthiazole kinase-like uncharacterized protein yjeF
VTASSPVVVSPVVLRDRPLPDHGDTSSKNSRGQLLVVGGTAESPGAVYLAGMAALRAGAGTLQVATVAPAAGGLALLIPEARVVGIRHDDPATFDDHAVEMLSPLLDEADAVLIGPGTFTPDSTRRLVHRAVEALTGSGAGLVVDAGSLPILSETPELLVPLGDRAVLMPNPSEMALLLDVGIDSVEDDPEGTLRTAVDRFGCVVTLRAPETWTAAPGGPPYLDQSGTSGLATSGSGDVLAGIIGGYVARGASGLDAVLWATHVHGTAAMQCATHSGDVGFLARELLDEIGPSHRMLGA